VRKELQGRKSYGKGAHQDEITPVDGGTKKRSELRLGGSVVGEGVQNAVIKRRCTLNMPSRTAFYSTLDIEYL
jgi:hypothetical protein